MPTFVYKGLGHDQKEAMVNDVMAPLESDYEPTPCVGGFPGPSGGNPDQYYPVKGDTDKTRDQKSKNRKAYRAERLKEAKEGVKAADAKMTLFGVEFPKDVPVEITLGPSKVDNKAMLVKKLTALCRAGMFEEVVKTATPAADDKGSSARRGKSG